MNKVLSILKDKRIITALILGTIAVGTVFVAKKGLNELETADVAEDN